MPLESRMKKIPESSIKSELNPYVQFYYLYQKDVFILTFCVVLIIIIKCYLTSTLSSHLQFLTSLSLFEKVVFDMIPWSE